MQDIYVTFEFEKIKEKINEYAKTELGKIYISELAILPSFDAVKNVLEDLKEVDSLITRFGILPIHTSANALYLIDLAKKTGLLTPRDLHLIAEDVLTSQNLIKYFNKIDVSYPRCKAKIETFNDLAALEKEIHRVITNALTIADNATPELKEIRGKIKREKRSSLKKSRLYLLPIANILMMITHPLERVT